MKYAELPKSIRHLAGPAMGIVLGCALLPGVALANSGTCGTDTNTNLVRNGGFESGSGTDIPNWTVEWDSSVDPYVYLDTTNPHSGAQDLKMGTVHAPNDIVQRIKGTETGAVYTICFWLYSSPNPAAGVTSFEVLWNNTPNMEFSNSGQFGYQYFSFNVIAQGNNLDYLRFRERNNEGFYYLDDVAIQVCTGCGLREEDHKQLQN